MKFVRVAVPVVLISAMCPITGFAQKLVDPNVVAPEFREAAEKRRAEQLKVRECTRKAYEAKVLPRDRTAHIQQCLDEKSD
jgi:hypothetical protein